jgi:hypothetical protein
MSDCLEKYAVEVVYSVGEIGNYYGGLNVKRGEDGYLYWGIENYDGIGWEQINKELFIALVTQNIHVIENDGGW